MNAVPEIHVEGASRPWEPAGEGVRRQIIAYGPDLMMVRVQFETGGIGHPHQHVHVQSCYVNSGVFDVTISGKTKRLNAGDSFYVPSNALHGVVAIEAGELIDAFNPVRQDFLTPKTRT